MKSLKRTLSLVLVLVMVLGLFGVAGAAFTDDAKIQYKEAVDVMTGIGAIDGMGDGTFAPTGSITRAQAAKMVTYAVLGKTNAEALGGLSSSFKDVTVAGGFDWAIPSIEYLKQQGIVEGRGNGIYDPNGKVTSYELAKMLLCAIGYGKNKEFSGDNYELDVAILANNTDIFAGRAKTASKLGDAATREEAALYCFNALTQDDAVQVRYIKVLDVYSPLSETIGEEVYGLKKSTTVLADDYGRPATGWTAKKLTGSETKLIAAVGSASPIYTSTTTVKLAETKLALINKGYTFGTTVNIYTNGYEQKDVAITGAPATLGGNGVQFEVYADASGKVTTIVMVNTYLANVIISGKDNASTTTVDERRLTITIDGRNTYAYPEKNTKAVDATVGFDVAYSAVAALTAAGKTASLLAVPNKDNTVAEERVLKLDIPATKTLTPTSYTSTGFVADASYSYGKYVIAPVTSANFGAHTVVFDSFGYVLAAIPEVTTGDYAVVTRYKTNTSWEGGNPTYEAELILADGSTLVVPTGIVKPDSLVGNIVEYQKNASTGAYTLTARGSMKADKELQLTTGVAKFTFESAQVANSKTVFIVATTNATTGVTTYKSYVGIANVPSYSNTNDADGAIFVKSDGIAAVVYLNNPTITAAPTTDTVFVPGTAVQVTTADGSYWLANAVVNGEVKQIKMASNYAIGAYTSVTVVNGIYALATTADIDFTSITPVTNGIIKINGTDSYAVASDCVVYTYNALGVVETATLADLASDVTAGCLTLNAKTGQVNAIFLAVM